jgi:small subunit ribosomal protein S7
MSRRRRSVERKVDPDQRYKSVLVTQFVSKLMLDGQRNKSESVFYGALDKIKEVRKDEDPFKVFSEAVKKVCPAMEVKSRRVGGATYQVPMEIRRKRSVSLAIRWIIKAARDKRGSEMKDRLAKELMDACDGVGVSIKKRDDVHRMAEANKAFVHFRW